MIDVSFFEQYSLHPHRQESIFVAFHTKHGKMNSLGGLLGKNTTWALNHVARQMLTLGISN